MFDAQPIASLSLTSVIPHQSRVLGVTKLVKSEISHVRIGASGASVPKDTRVTLKLRRARGNGDDIEIQLHEWRDWRVSVAYCDRYQHYSIIVCRKARLIPQMPITDVLSYMSRYLRMAMSYFCSK